MKPIIIGIGHKARQGKDTTAKAIHEAFPHITWIYSQADALKSWCRVESLMETKDSLILQKVGEAKRQHDPAVWIRANWFQMCEKDYPYALVPDLRYCNEANWIRESGGFLIKVVRYLEDGTQYIDSSRDPRHVSETDLDDWPHWDYCIHAKSGEVENIQKQAISIFSEIVSKVSARV